jgi:peroxiredoxin
LQSQLSQLQAAGVSVVAVSFDSVDVLKKFAAAKTIAYPLLADEGSKAIASWKLLNKEAPKQITGVPYPGTFILDKTGKVRAKLFHDGYRARHTAADILKAVAALKP